MKSQITMAELGGSEKYFHKSYTNTSSSSVTDTIDVGFSPKIVVITFKRPNNDEGYSIWDSTINSSKFVEVLAGTTYTANHGQMASGGYYGDCSVSGTQVSFYAPNMSSVDVYVIGD